MTAVRRRLSLLFGLSLAGVLFAGYLSAQKLFSHVCAFNESCASFLGYPTCYYGFAMFLTLLILSTVALLRPARTRSAFDSILAVSALGILFAGYFTAIEIPPVLMDPMRYSLILPTCSYGLLVYLAIFFIARRARG